MECNLLYEPLITIQELCDWLSISPPTEQRWRRAGLGPRFVILGPRRIAYRPEAVKKWIAAREYKQGGCEPNGKGE